MGQLVKLVKAIFQALTVTNSIVYVSTINAENW